ncbi:MAG: hypothetical protein QNJ45_04045 [Ardenticatenaceae bacterium]|nr:hypothetical protein [Ardenticatenaceae bacterium]
MKDQKVSGGLRWVTLALGAVVFLALCGGVSFYLYQFYTQYQPTVSSVPGNADINSLPLAVKADPQWQTYANAETVRDLISAHGYWWLATDGGLVVIDPQNETQVHLTVDHGLPGNRLTTIAADLQGNIWIGTENRGIVRYNGRRWKTFTMADGLPGLSVSRLVVDREGVVWSVVSNRLIRFDGQVWRTVRFNLLNVVPPRVNDVASGLSGLWVGSEEGVWRYNGSDWENYSLNDGLINDQVSQIRVGGDGTVWAVTPAGIGRFTAGRWDRITVKDGLYEAKISDLFPRSNGTAWIGYEDSSVSEIAFFDGAITHQSLPRSSVQMLKQIGDQLFVGTATGLWRSDSTGRDWAAITLPSDVPQGITDWAENETGVWLTSDRGTYLYENGGWGIISDFPAAAIAINGSQVVVAGEFPDAGLSLYDGTSWSRQGCDTAGPNTNTISSGALAPNGWVWFASDWGAMGFDGARWHSFSAGWPAESVARSIVVDEDNQVWVGLEEGLFRLDPGQGRWELIIPENVFRLTVDPAGLVWFVSNNGIAHLVDDRPAFIPFPPVESPTYGFVSNENGLWLSSKKGVVHFSEGQWERYDLSDGLASEEVTTLAIDQEGDVYAGYANSRLGFSVFENGRWSTIHNIIDPQAENGGHGPSFGPRRDEVMTMGVTAGQRVWFGTYFGEVGSVAPDQLLYQPDDFRLVWSSARSIVVDQEGSVWIADREARLARYWPEQDQWVRYESDLSRAAVSDVIATSSGVWLGTELGIVALNDQRCSFVEHREELQVVSGILEETNNRIWWATANNGAIALDLESGELDWPILGLRGRTFIDFATDQQDRLWFLTSDQLFQLVNERVVTIDLDERLIENQPHALALTSSGQPWVGSEEGIYLLGRSDWEKLDFDRKLADQNIFRIEMATTGDIWFMTAGGVSVYSP